MINYKCISVLLSLPICLSKQEITDFHGDKSPAVIKATHSAVKTVVKDFMVSLILKLFMVLSTVWCAVVSRRCRAYVIGCNLVDMLSYTCTGVESIACRRSIAETEETAEIQD
ncbi:hypothetical protein DAPPUDRAFT_314374 [Daphnia pulex]|uniref:Uncharacterized protein n=1 Tax=Daphnia pulex TaxID=6669 RepID=E9G5W9_DAPPU|nr:hypothetical protein DAPPUDRAFT_314374 [Daphnia pulex]|eukprot:EFX84839.1 hypothetical protein DAPPUDRAFT_314374 [Daphnia pulex]